MNQPASSSHIAAAHTGRPAGAPAEVEKLDLREFGAPKEGVPQVSDKRLYMQLQVFTGCSNPADAVKILQGSSLESVVYSDVNDPKGIGVLIMSENPSVFANEARALYNQPFFSSLQFRPEMTMFGRSYSAGREADLADWLLKKPRRNALTPKYAWTVWYPLRRKPEFELLTKEEQGKILFEHAKIGMTYGQNDLVHDIRLACYGMDAHDNEFVLGLVSADLHPLSRVVQDMRKTQQTARYIQSLGPFFIGKVFWQAPLKPEHQKTS